MNPHFFTAPFYFAFIWFRVQGSRFRVQRVQKVQGGGATHFVILSGEKGRVLKNGLSENMRTESKDLSAAKYKNSLPLEGKVPPKGRIGHRRYERQMRKAEKCAAHVGKKCVPEPRITKISRFARNDDTGMRIIQHHFLPLWGSILRLRRAPSSRGCSAVIQKRCPEYHR